MDDDDANIDLVSSFVGGIGRRKRQAMDDAANQTVSTTPATTATTAAASEKAKTGNKDEDYYDYDNPTTKAST